MSCASRVTALLALSLLTLPCVATAAPGKGEARATPRLREAEGGATLALDLGAGFHYFGGYAEPKLVLSGEPDRKFHTHGRNFAFKLHYDVEANGLDWRLGLSGGAPAAMGAAATVGLRKDVSPARQFHLLSRVGAGAELSYMGKGPAEYFLPNLLGEGELSMLFPVGDSSFLAGPALELNLRYGLPLGLGLGMGVFLRIQGAL